MYNSEYHTFLNIVAFCMQIEPNINIYHLISFRQSRPYSDSTLLYKNNTTKM